jgi:hypothetical protein
MDMWLVAELDGSGAAPNVSATAMSVSSFPSIPDPLRLRAEGIAIASEENAPDAVVSAWCGRAQECLSFLAATDPSRTWIWQEQVLPVLLALSSRRTTRSAGSGESAVPVDQPPAARPQRQRHAAARARKGNASAILTGRAGAARFLQPSPQRLKHQALRPKRDGRSGRTPPYRRDSRCPSPHARRRTGG